MAARTTVADAWIQEQAALKSVPHSFDGFVEHTKRASPTGLIYFGCNRYSVFVIAKMDKRDSIKLLPLGAWALSAPLGVV